MSSAIRAVLLILALCLTFLVGEVVPVAQAQEQIAIQKPAAEERDDIKALKQSVATLEAGQGAYASALPEQLYSLGLGLQKAGRHAEALAVFKQGLHLTRVNEGLYSLQQVPFIQGQIRSNLAQGKLDDADQHQTYLLMIQKHSMVSGVALIHAMLQQADWQKKAYELGIGGEENGFLRLQAMWNLYSTAVADISTREGTTSLNLIAPLMGLMKTQYMISTQYSAARSQSAQISSQRTQYDIEYSQSYKMGKSIILSIHDVEVGAHGTPSLQSARTLVMLGDWMMWNKKRDSANKAYTEAVQELTKLDDAKMLIENIFGKPVPLPDIDGIHWMPTVVEPGEGKVLLEFGVNKRGRVHDLTRLDSLDKDKRKVQRLMRRIHDRQFRSRYEGTKPVDTEKILWAYDVK